MRSIIVPLSAEAMGLLDFNQAKSSGFREVFIPEDKFKDLWALGLFQSLNNALTVLIDDFEDESIVGVKRLKIAQNIVRKYLEKGEEMNSELLKQIEGLLDLAITKETGLFFYF